MITTGPLWDFLVWMFLIAFQGNIIVFGLAILFSFLVLAFFSRLTLPTGLFLGIILLASMSCPGNICGGENGFFQAIEFVALFMMFTGASLLLAGYSMFRRFFI